MTTEAEKMRVFARECIAMSPLGDGALRALVQSPDDTDLVAQVAIHYGLAPTAEVCAALVEIARDRG